MSTAIKVDDATVEYGDQRVLDIHRLRVAGTGLVAVVGPNGAGKSTLLRLCAGLQRPKNGTVEIDGVKAHRRAARLKAGYSPDHPVLFDDLTIADNIAYAHTSSGAVEPTPLADDLVAAFDLEGLLKRFPTQLSRGQQQASSLVVAASRPVEIMLFDEPTIGLDQDRRALLGSVLQSHAKEFLFVVAAHDPGLIGMAKRRIALAGGHVTSV
ncbi:MAG: ATP-binding cassette domain-containing protein [Acidimicrobiia bacterium]